MSDRAAYLPDDRRRPRSGAGTRLVGWLVGGAHLVAARRRFRRFKADNHRALAALARGDFAQAKAALEAWARVERPPIVAAHARHNLAWTAMREGDLATAIAGFADNDRRYAYQRSLAGIQLAGAANLALAYALDGQLDAARSWIAELGRAPADAMPHGHEAIRAFALAIADCRSGRAADVARDLAERWAEYEAVLAGATLRPFRIVRAFATATTDGPRSAGIVDATLMLSRPVYPREYALLGCRWPEMAAFLAAHKLSG